MTPPIVLSAEFIGVVRSLINSLPSMGFSGSLSPAARNLFYDITARARRLDRAYDYDFEDDVKDECDCHIAFNGDERRILEALEQLRRVKSRRPR